MQKKMKDDIARVLLGQEQIQSRVRELAAQIQEDYAGKELVMVLSLIHIWSRANCKHGGRPPYPLLYYNSGIM